MAIASLVSGLAGPVAGLLDKFIEDKDQKNQLAHDIATLADKQAHEQIMAQVEVNKQEAATITSLAESQCGEEGKPIGSRESMKEKKARVESLSSAQASAVTAALLLLLLPLSLQL